MVPTFVIGLREGLEAALIVGIIAAFLRKQGRLDLVRWVFVGVGSAVLLCLGVGVALEVLSHNLPQRQQEGLETVIGALAIGMVTYMVVWMRRHSREMKGQLEGLAAQAIGGDAPASTEPAPRRTATRAGRAMVAMAFLAVLREGFETVVFLLAAFNESANTVNAAGGALLGIAVAVALGYGIYRGGVHINLSKFFRATGLVLVLVAAGLVVSALRTAHEAGWLEIGQARTLDLSALVQPGSVQSSLLTGMLGIQAHPVLIELIGWLVYLIPVGLYVAWPPNRAVPRRALARALAGAGALAGIAALVLGLSAPNRPAHRPVTSAAGTSAQLVDADPSGVAVRTRMRSPAAQQAGPQREIALRHSGSAQRAGIATDVYTARMRGSAATGLPARLSVERIAALNGGRLPLGLHAGADSSAPAVYTDSISLRVWVEPRTERIVDLRWSERVDARVRAPRIGLLALSEPVAAGSVALPQSAVQAAASAAASDLADLDERADLRAAAWGTAVAALVLLATAAVLRFTTPRTGASAPTSHPATTLARS